MKNALQAQLLKAGLVDEKKAKKINRQHAHAQKSGTVDVQIKADIAQAQAEKLAKDQALNREQQQVLQDKARTAAVRQMLAQHHITGTSGDVTYQFIDQGKIKKLYVGQPFYDQIVRGQIAIARLDETYLLIPRVLAEKINSHAPDLIVVHHDKPQASHSGNVVLEDDPYAAFVIPDDLMW